MQQWLPGRLLTPLLMVGGMEVSPLARDDADQAFGHHPKACLMLLLMDTFVF